MMTDTETAPQAEGPLKGLRVIEIGMLFAGPLAGTTLADMGADVIKICLLYTSPSPRDS